MKNIITLLLFILSTLLSACGVGAQPSAPGTLVDPSASLAYDSVAKRQDLSAAQTALAQQQRVEKAATAAAIARAEAARATEQAFELQQRQAIASATIAAVQLAATVSAQNAQATFQARSAEQTAAGVKAEQTQQAVSAAAAATATAQEIQASAERQAATATAQAVNIAMDGAQVNRARTQSDDEFYALLRRLAVVLAIVAVFILSILGVNQYLQTAFLRRTVLETRLGTMVFITGPQGRYTPTILTAPSMLQLPAGIDEEPLPSEAQVVDAGPIVFNHGGKQSLIARMPDPNESERRLALRLLRESMKVAGPQVNRIPTAQELGWSSETRARAVAILKPHVTTQRGRNGGTFVADQYRTLVQLYSDLGARKVALSPPPTNGHAQP